MNHYIYCKKNGRSFRVEDTTWLFKYKLGWLDYFESIDLHYDTDQCEPITVRHTMELEYVSLHQYRNIIPEIYRYNAVTRQRIAEKKEELGLMGSSYDSIFIRRGDKLLEESDILPAHHYLEVVLKKNPSCTTVFLQTDDYNCFLELETYIREHSLTLHLKTLCKPHCKGMVLSHTYVQERFYKVGQHKVNRDYLLDVMQNWKHETPINQMNAEEIYDHTLTMILGIDMVLGSQTCVCDYSSNVARFIKLAHPNCINVIIPDTDIDMNQTRCPGAGPFLVANRVKKVVVNCWVQGTAKPGIGDLILGSLALYQLCKTLGYDYVVDTHLHPISAFFKNRHTPYSGLLDTIRDTDVPFLNHHHDLVRFLTNHPFDLILLNTNHFCKTEITDEEIAFMKTVIQPSQDIEEKVRSICNTLPPEFSILHFRLGDDIAFRKMMNSNINFYATLLLRAVDANDLFLCDSAEFKLLVREQLGVNCLDLVGGHIGEEQDYEKLQNTMIEFYVATRAKTIKFFSSYPGNTPSGFIKMTAILHDIPLLRISP